MAKPVDRICDAAIQCFLEFGIEKTSMDDIARVAGMARPNLYRYVKDRDDLIKMVSIYQAHVFTAELGKLRGPWEDVLTEIFVQVIEKGREDAIVQMVIEQAAPTAARLIGNEASGVAASLNGVLIPVIQDARKSGRLRDDITDAEVIWWVHFQAWCFAREREIVGGIDLRGLVRKFVVGALCVPSHTSVHQTSPQKDNKLAGRP